MGFVGDPDAIDAVAVTFEKRAADLARLGRQASQRAKQLDYHGRRADRFRASVEEQRRRADRRAAELRDVARDLHRTASRVRRQVQHLGRLERLVRAAIHAYAPVAGAFAPWELAGWDPRDLPAAADESWERIARSIGIR